MDKKTRQQEKSYHKYFELLANALNDAGWDQRKTLKESISIPWTKEAVKDQIWKPIMKAMYTIDSTTEQTTANVNAIYEVVNREIGKKTGVTVPFPSNEPSMLDDMEAYKEYYQTRRGKIN